MSLVFMAKLGVCLSAPSDSDYVSYRRDAPLSGNTFTRPNVSELVQKKAILDAVDVVHNIAPSRVSTAALSISRYVLPPLRW